MSSRAQPSENYVEVAVQRGNLVQKDITARCSHQYFDVTLPPNLPDNFTLIFQNYYTAALTICQESPTGGYKTFLDWHYLMSSPDAEEKAQYWHAISSKDDLKGKISSNKPIRILLHQPTNIWMKYEIRNLKVVYTKSEPRAKNAGSSSSSGNKSLFFNNVFNTESSSYNSMLLSDWEKLCDAVDAESKAKPGTKDLLQSGLERGRTGKRAVIKEKEKEKEKDRSSSKQGLRTSNSRAASSSVGPARSNSLDNSSAVNGSATASYSASAKY